MKYTLRSHPNQKLEEQLAKNAKARLLSAPQKNGFLKENDFVKLREKYSLRHTHFLGERTFWGNVHPLARGRQQERKSKTQEPRNIIWVAWQ